MPLFFRVLSVARACWARPAHVVKRFDLTLVPPPPNTLVLYAKYILSGLRIDHYTEVGWFKKPAFLMMSHYMGEDPISDFYSRRLQLPSTRHGED